MKLVVISETTRLQIVWKFNKNEGVGEKPSHTIRPYPERWFVVVSSKTLNPTTVSDAFGNQTISLGMSSKHPYQGDSRLCAPASQQVCLYRVQSFDFEKSAMVRTCGQTRLNIMSKRCQYSLLPRHYAGR